MNFVKKLLGQPIVHHQPQTYDRRERKYIVKDLNQEIYNQFDDVKPVEYNGTIYYYTIGPFMFVEDPHGRLVKIKSRLDLAHHIAEKIDIYSIDDINKVFPDADWNTLFARKSCRKHCSSSCYFAKKKSRFIQDTDFNYDECFQSCFSEKVDGCIAQKIKQLEQLDWDADEDERIRSPRHVKFA